MITSISNSLMQVNNLVEDLSKKCKLKLKRLPIFKSQGRLVSTLWVEINLLKKGKLNLTEL